ncbi:uncharacterized protein LOC131242554 [Magnolia sinica]|uniref:uncharacterized protein LOC131242554 n=1 Tax=Magnolia sinica TaxID=86752 RepID=UPI0026594765|nr:uncharacterized protein LOC131242554 [Magnolia sinica]
MERDPEELQYLNLREILKESISIPKSSPRTFTNITLLLVFPLSFAILAHSLLTHPLVQKINHSSSTANHDSLLLLLYQLLYLLFLFAFSLLSTAAVVFTVASLYTSKPTSFSSTLSAIPRILHRLFITYLWISLLMLSYNFLFIAIIFSFVAAFPPDDSNGPLVVLTFLSLFVLFIAAHVYITALWHIASVISVLEPVYGLAAMQKSRELLRGKTRDAATLVLIYLLLCAAIGTVFSVVVVHGAKDYGLVVRVLVGGVCVGLLVVVNMIGLLVQSIFYYICKSHHHQGIDKSALYEQLGGYLGEYVPLKSSIQMESLES